MFSFRLGMRITSSRHGMEEGHCGEQLRVVALHRGRATQMRSVPLSEAC
jgi:hypothetical protein